MNYIKLNSNEKIEIDNYVKQGSKLIINFKELQCDIEQVFTKENLKHIEFSDDNNVFDISENLVLTSKTIYIDSNRIKLSFSGLDMQEEENLKLKDQNEKLADAMIESQYKKLLEDI